MNMMKIEEVVGDVILVILENYDPLKKIGIKSDKIFVRVKGYDEHGMWIHQPQFNIPKINSTKKNDIRKVKASILIPDILQRINNGMLAKITLTRASVIGS